MNPELLQGQWEGFYLLGPEYPFQYRKRKFAFTINLTFDNGLFRGTCTDVITRKHFDRPATIEGSLTNNVFSFVKKYPGFIGMLEDGKEFVDMSLPPIEVNYTGKVRRKWFTRQLHVSGEWKIFSSIVREDGSLQEFNNTGDWEMYLVK